MEDKYTKILESVYPNKKTLENYESRIRGLLKKMGPVTLQSILENPDVHYSKIQKSYPNSKALLVPRNAGVQTLPKPLLKEPRLSRATLWYL